MCFFISDDAIAIHHPFMRILALTRLLIPGLSDPVTQRGDFITIMTVIAFLVLGIVALAAQFTKFGRSLYAIGGDEQSARLMGLAVPTTKVLVYTFNGFCSALAGIVLAAFVASGHGLYASGFELRAIAAVVMGGTSLVGGSGYVLGTLFGVLILGITQTLIQFNGSLSSWWTNIVIGLLTFRLHRRPERPGGEAKAPSPRRGHGADGRRPSKTTPARLAGGRRRTCRAGGPGLDSRPAPSACRGHGRRRGRRLFPPALPPGPGRQFGVGRGRGRLRTKWRTALHRRGICRLRTVWSSATTESIESNCRRRRTPYGNCWRAFATSTGSPRRCTTPGMTPAGSATATTSP
jgi:hypothetical protein